MSGPGLMENETVKMTEATFESHVRSYILAQDDFLMGTKAGVEAWRAGQTRPLSDIKRELGDGGDTP